MAYLCQRCKLPLRMDESFAALSPSAYDMMSSLSDRSAVLCQHLSSDAYNRTTPSSPNAPRTTHARPGRPIQPLTPSRVAHAVVPGASYTTSHPAPPSQGPAESFVVLSESTLGAARAQPQPQAQDPPENVSPALSAQRQIERLLKLASLLSVESIERPLCTECTDIVLELMSNQLQDAKADRDRYALFERELNRERLTGITENGTGIMEEIVQLKKRETEANEKLKITEAEYAIVEAELKSLDLEEAELEKEEQDFWQDFNQYELELIELKSKCNSVTSRCRQDKLELDQLRHTNVFKDAFCIGCEGGVGTINGLRLGRLPVTPVQWIEINAAWGHTVLLLQTLCRRFNMTLDGYKLVPMGSFSRVEKTKGDKTSLELYGSDDFAFTKMLHNRRFDNAMVDFLECLRQVLEVAAKRSPRNKVPFGIHRDRIGEVSIKLSFSSEEAWTTALRHVLFSLKILNGSFDSMR